MSCYHQLLLTNPAPTFIDFKKDDKENFVKGFISKCVEKGLDNLG
jgi:hypothetical protein